jgi:hypothetical protein
MGIKGPMLEAETAEQSEYRLSCNKRAIYVFMFKKPFIANRISYDYTTYD